jgi:L-threonylcarbamoyladenylate synthase
MSKLRKAIFLDRDGTLIEDVGVLSHPDQVRLFPDTAQALLKLQEEYLLFVVSNQSGVAQGKLSMGQVDAVNERLNELLSEAGVQIQEWYVCPHGRDEGCECIKPKPGFFLRAAQDYGLDLKKSFVIGDHPHDALTANEQGVFGLYVLSGHGGKHLQDLPADILVFHRLGDAAEWILKHPGQKADIDRQIEEGAALLAAGKVVALPTETVYGLGADVFNPDALARVFEIKKRPMNNPLIAHIADAEQVEQLATIVPEKAKMVMEAFWPGPLTIVLPKKAEVPDVATAGHPTVAIRMPASPIARKLIRLSGTAVAAPSANAFTYTSPTTAQHVIEQLGDACDMVIDGGACRVGVESTVLSFTGERPVLLRPGGVSAEEIEAVIGPIDTVESKPRVRAESPGLMPNHYAPETPLILVDEIPEEYEDAEDVAILLFQSSDRSFAGVVDVLSEHGDVKEAAANLYAAMRRLDTLGLREIIVEKAPSHGLGVAINNRLTKASRGRSE